MESYQTSGAAQRKHEHTVCHLLMSLGIKLVIFQTVNKLMVPFGGANMQNAQCCFQLKLAQFFVLSFLGLFLFVFTAQLHFFFFHEDNFFFIRSSRQAGVVSHCRICNLNYPSPLLLKFDKQTIT